MSMSKFFDVVLFLLSSLVTGPRFMSISSLVLELWQFLFIRHWPEIWKSEIPTSEFFSISGDWGELWISNLARMSLIECYRMLQSSRVTAFAIFELLTEHQLGGRQNYPPLPPLLAHLPRLGVYAGNENFCIELYMDLHTILHHFKSLLIKRVQNWCPRIFRNPYSRQWWESLCWLFLNWWLHTDK